MSQYPIPPPSYGSTSPKNNTNREEAQHPLLASSSHGAGGIYDQPAHDDVPDDFKVFIIRVLTLIQLHADPPSSV
jgi:protein lifeguard